MTTPAVEKVQTTPEFTVEGADIFKFGATDQVPGPGAETAEPATPAPAADDPGKATADESAAAPAEGEPTPAEKPRFKDHQAAEEGYRHLQAKATKAEQEAAELRRKVAEQEQQQAAAREQQAQSGRQAEIEKAIDDYTAERNEKALEAIEALDPDDPEHRKKVARIWGQFHSDVRKYTASPVDKDGKPLVVTAATPEQSSAPATPAKEAAPSTAATPATPAPATVEQRRSQIKGYIDGKARAAGIDPETDELWAGVALTTPDKDADGKVIPLDDQIEWTINRYNERKAAIMARARQESNLPMGEGGRVHRSPGSGSGGKAPAGPIGLGDAIAAANERRRL